MCANIVAHITGFRILAVNNNISDRELIKLNFNLVNKLNDETKQRSYNVADICKKLAPRFGLNTDEMYTIGLMHDIGKMYIPDAILKKDGALSVLEREIIDLHSYYGYVILKK